MNENYSLLLVQALQRRLYQNEPPNKDDKDSKKDEEGNQYHGVLIVSQHCNC